MTNRHRFPRLLALGTAVSVVVLAGCSAGSLGSSSGGGSGGTTITWLTTSEQAAQANAKAVVDAFEKANPTIKVNIDARPGGSDGDNLVKTRLQTGSMDDVFDYNSGSLFQQIAPEKNLTPLDGTVLTSVQDSFKPQVTANGKVYGVPYGTAFGGGIMYNKDVFAKAGLQVPKTWDELVSDAQKIKASGTAPVLQSYQDTWTSQLLVLGDFHNVQAVDPHWAEKYTKNQAKYANPPALEGFKHLQEIHDKKLENTDYASTTYDQALKKLADGEGAMYPILSNAIPALLVQAPDSSSKIGFFAIPGKDAATYGLTAWYPNGMYVPATTTGAKLDAVKKLLAFVASKSGCEALTSASAPTGPYLVDGCSLPSDVPQVTQDVQTFFDNGNQSPALEFLSPVKGPNLEQITVEVGSGIASAQKGAALYDQDVAKQAKQLNLPGW